MSASSVLKSVLVYCKGQATREENHLDIEEDQEKTYQSQLHQGEKAGDPPGLLSPTMRTQKMRNMKLDQGEERRGGTPPTL